MTIGVLEGIVAVASTQRVTLPAGEHTLFIATTHTAHYHFVAFYQFGLTSEEAP